MRNLFITAFFFFSLVVFSQATKDIKVIKAKVTGSKSLSDFIAGIPKDCKVTSFIFSADFGSSLKEFTVIGDAIPAEVKDLINKRLEKGKSFFIERINSDCEKFHSTNYKVVLD